MAIWTSGAVPRWLGTLATRWDLSAALATQVQLADQQRLLLLRPFLPQLVGHLLCPRPAGESKATATATELLSRTN